VELSPGDRVEGLGNFGKPTGELGTVEQDGVGLDLANFATIEITSENEAHPIECALQLGETREWRAADSGPQIIRLLFDHSQKLKRIWLVFEETETRRTQEFAFGRTFLRESFVNNGISAHLSQCGRLKTTPSIWKYGRQYIPWSRIPRMGPLEFKNLEV
jgi:hypothetical protein